MQESDHLLTISNIETAKRPVSLSELCEYARALELTGRPADSLAVAKQIYLATPTEATACQYAATLCRLGERDPAMMAEMMGRYPSCDFLRAAVAEMALCDGNYEYGFHMSRYRWAASHADSKRSQINLPEWDGLPIDGRLIVLSEQGIGEEILHSSCYRLLPDAIITADQRLHSLFSRSFPQHLFIEKSAARHYHGSAVIESMELFRVMNRRGNARPWLKADQDRTKALRDAMTSAFPSKLLVGLSWASSRKGLSESKSIPIDDLLPIMQSGELACFNLQYGDCIADTQRADDIGGNLYGIGGIDLTHNQDGLASMISALDVVVTCSNSVAHLAGALGKRTILVAPGGRFVLWYWGKSDDRTPWYPSVRIVRAFRGWPEAVQQCLRMLTIDRPGVS